MPAGAPTIQIPRWIQLVAVPITALIVLLIVGKVFHAVFLFLVAGLIALLLDPLVRALEKLWIPRGLSIAIVYLSFAAALAVVVFAVGLIVVDQTESAANRVDAYLTTESGQPPRTGFEHDVDRLQRWLDTHHLERIDIEEQGQDFADNIQGQDVEKYTSEVIDFARGAAISIFQLLFSIVLIVVVSIYMLLDMSRLKRAVDRRLPPTPGKPGLVVQMEKAVAGYVRGQVLLSLIIGTSAGIGLYVLGRLGLFEGGETYAVLFGAWVAVAELIPYLGPWLGAIPPVIYALIVDPVSAIWVTLLFLGIHQIEGHIVVPKVMGSALRLHPLLVIFGLLAGGELYGLPGIFVALPLLAVLRAIWEFFSERIELEAWKEAAQRPVRVSGPVEGVSVEPGGSPGQGDPLDTVPISPVPPEEPPEEPPEAKVAP